MKCFEIKPVQIRVLFSLAGCLQLFGCVQLPSPAIKTSGPNALWSYDQSERVRIVKVKDQPQLITSGEIIDLNFQTIIFKPKDNNNYQAVRSNFNWIDSSPSNPAGFATFSVTQTTPDQLIELPESFQFFGKAQTQIYLSPKGRLTFPKDPNSTPQPGQPNCKLGSSEPSDWISCGAGISITSRNTVGETGGYFEYGAIDDGVTKGFLITFTTNTDATNPNTVMQYQVFLASNGDIHLTTGRMDNPTLPYSSRGLTPGNYAATIKTTFDSTTETNENTPTGMIEHSDSSTLNYEAVGELLQTGNPGRYFDAVFIVSDFALANGTSQMPMMKLYKTSETGLGTIVNSSMATFNTDLLPAVISLANLDTADISPTSTSSRSLANFMAHEFAHKWIAHTQVLANSAGHWNEQTNTPTLYPNDLTQLYSSVMGGRNYSVKDQGGVANPYGYSALDLYLMGLLPAALVPEDSCGFAPITQDSPYCHSFQSLISKLGTRYPTYEFSRKTFNAAFIYLTKDISSDSEFTIETRQKAQLLSEHLDFFQTYFKAATNGVGSVVFEGEKAIVQTPVFPDSVPQKLRDKVSLLIDQVSDDPRKSSDLYALLVGKLKFTPAAIATCEMINCAETPESWPRDQWVFDLTTISDEELGRLKSSIDLIFQTEKLKSQSQSYHSSFQSSLKVGVQTISEE